MALDLTEEFKTKIEAKIAELENLCSVEFVPVIAQQSSVYHAFKFYVVFGSLYASLALLSYWHPIDWRNNITMSLAIGLILIAALHSGFIFRLLLPKSIRQREVEDAAHRFFLKEEVFATHNRRGVLIYISMLEKAVFIVADRGVTAKVPPKEWAELGAKLAHDFARQNAGETFLEALDLLAKRLTKDFPPEPGAKSELANNVRVE